MDILRLIEDEHDEAKSVFRRLSKAEGRQAAELWSELKQKLILHEELEERLFYPQLKQAPQAYDLVLEGYQEHHVMDVLIEEISLLKPGDEAWQPKIKVLQENTEHHIEEEESELFPKVRKIWDTDERKRLGEQWQAEKELRQTAIGRR
jgi:hemerythrin-like domain-containing protein